MVTLVAGLAHLFEGNTETCTNDILSDAHSTLLGSLAPLGAILKLHQGTRGCSKPCLLGVRWCIFVLTIPPQSPPPSGPWRIPEAQTNSGREYVGGHRSSGSEQHHWLAGCRCVGPRSKPTMEMLPTFRDRPSGGRRDRHGAAWAIELVFFPSTSLPSLLVMFPATDVSSHSAAMRLREDCCPQ